MTFGIISIFRRLRAVTCLTKSISPCKRSCVLVLRFPFELETTKLVQRMRVVCFSLYKPLNELQSIK